jgi:hypothetical protein
MAQATQFQDVSFRKGLDDKFNRRILFIPELMFAGILGALILET